MAKKSKAAPVASSSHDGSSHSKGAKDGMMRRKDRDYGATTSTSKSSRRRGGERSGGGTVAGGEEDHPDLAELEERLNLEVDEEFFQDPRKFHTLHRVIDVLGMQIGDTTNHFDGPVSSTTADLDQNPAYRNLKEQQQVVEEAIEHLALIHCADLNGSANHQHQTLYQVVLRETYLL